jgi:hypothetical protein
MDHEGRPLAPAGVKVNGSAVGDGDRLNDGQTET